METRYFYYSLDLVLHWLNLPLKSLKIANEGITSTLFQNIQYKLIAYQTVDVCNHTTPQGT